jgi:hypothetical protein
VAQHPTADSRVFQQRRVPIAPDVRQQPPLQRPRVRRVQGQETPHPLRRGRGYPEAKHAAPVMADQPYPRQAKGVHEREHVPHLAGAVVAAGRGVGLAEAAQVHANQPVLRGRQADDVPPGVPMLRKAVQREHGVAGARDRARGTGFRDVQPRAADVHEAVAHPRYVREPAAGMLAGVMVISPPRLMEPPRKRP